MKKNRQVLKVFTYVVNQQKFKYIIKELVIYKTLIAGSILLLSFGLAFGDLFDNPYQFLVNTMVQLILLLTISILQGLFSFEAFKGLFVQRRWTKSIKMKYIIGEGVIGFGLWCGVVTQSFYPFKNNLWLSLSINTIIYAIAGLCFGSVMRGFWNMKDLDNIFKELEEVSAK